MRTVIRATAGATGVELLGSHRAPARAMLKAVGFTDDDLRPLVGIANTWIEIGPCNLHLRRLAAAVKDGVRAAGATPMEFNTVSVSDGITMGTEGMRMSLVSREVIADSIELVARANQFDALVILVGCDKTIPGAAMALARLDIPGSSFTADRLRRESGRGKTSPFKTSSRPSARSTRQARRGRIRGARERGVPWRRRVRRAVHGQHDGHGVRVPRASPFGSATVPAMDAGQGDVSRSRPAPSWSTCWARPTAAADSDARRLRKRDCRGRGDRRLDQCRPAPDGDRQRSGRAAEPRGLRPHQRLGAAPRRSEAGRPLRRD